MITTLSSNVIVLTTEALFGHIGEIGTMEFEIPHLPIIWQLPKELGMLSELESLYMDSAGVIGEIPSSFANLKNLEFLVLSSVSIPSNIMYYKSLQHLFLGNNKLNGTLPAEKSPRLLNINLVANNFNLESSNSSSVLPYGLNCLQRNFPCNRGFGICKYKFSIS
ncbi:hypothetical protein Patl1_29970 [Pistacia atlantica]|uniref:Uncharacterized protein n=1 Tax=Pistacia atlantica TaxID=434234 RepID=A0ACC1AB58_9ROSI|nr:hypothetical protein Patl1_29970 [Pistacia atlantica]